jgi:hypothetical protein
VQWSLVYRFDPNALTPQQNQLTRIGESRNYFSGIDWFRAPHSGSGFLEAGRYRLNLSSGVSGPFYSTESISFSVAIPAPATLGLLFAAPLAFRRRPRH